MAAAPAASQSPPAPVPPSALAGRGPVVRFTADDVHAMLRAGRLPEDASTELLDGCIVRTDKSAARGGSCMHSPGHRYSVTQLGELSSQINSPDRHVQTQLPIVCGSSQMPEPDFAVVRGTSADYMDRLPTAADVLRVIEVAHSSLERDREEKLPIYAWAGVTRNIILNLRHRTADAYGQANPTAGTLVLIDMVPSHSSINLLTEGNERVTVQLESLLAGVL